MSVLFIDFGPLRFRLRNNYDYLYLTSMGVVLVYYFIRFIREFIIQRAQYSIKSILILMLCVAILCSIYECIGLYTVLYIILIISAIAAHMAQSKNNINNQDK